MQEREALSYRILYLEQQLESYTRLHTQELEEMRWSLQQIKAEFCTQSPSPYAPTGTGDALGGLPSAAGSP